jgi:hypothetical protein
MADSKAIKRAHNFKDRAGQKFGRLTAISFVKTGPKTVAWHCQCECGNMVLITVSNIRKTFSCGCYHRERVLEHHTTHAMTKTPEYRAWQNAKKRCFDENNNRYYAA